MPFDEAPKIHSIENLETISKRFEVIDTEGTLTSVEVMITTEATQNMGAAVKEVRITSEEGSFSLLADIDGLAEMPMVLREGTLAWHFDRASNHVSVGPIESLEDLFGALHELGHAQHQQDDSGFKEMHSKRIPEKLIGLFRYLEDNDVQIPVELQTLYGSLSYSDDQEFQAHTIASFTQRHPKIMANLDMMLSHLVMALDERDASLRAIKFGKAIEDRLRVVLKTSTTGADPRQNLVKDFQGYIKLTKLPVDKSIAAIAHEAFKKILV